ncbi:M55 family metallopeptidase [candidate division KSB1 bacterium]|nr:M55 family metallopeptidase [bacterium]NUM67216.1 M55 family metallopeptidase [candidate division KSB1 bacterium]
MPSRVVILALLLLAGGSLLQAQPKTKIYISADMEGIAGVVSDAQLGPEGFEYQRFREFMTNEVNAAIDAAFAAGATEILVSDSHGNGQNLLLEKLPPNVQVVRSWPRPLMMMQGIDESFAGVIFIGYHTSTTNPRGVRAHSFSSATLAEVRLNGIAMSEAGFNAAIAGHFNVPVIMLSGDDAIVEEATGLLGNLEGAVVKWAYGFHSAKTLTPAAACELIRAKVTAAMKRLGEFKPYKLKTPVQLEVRFKNYRPSEVLSYLSLVQRTDAHSIAFAGKDMVEVSKFFEFILTYSPALAP